MKRLEPNRNSREKVENENLRPGSPPRPATEPPGAKGSSKSSKTMTDPGSGEPNRHR
jgi:hypothetical protein